MTNSNKPTVYKSYEKIIHWFDEHRDKSLMEKKYLDFILNLIPQGGSVLDLGCGTGEPIAKFFIEKGLRVTGVDGSQKMIALCRERFPHARWLVADMRDVDLHEQFDVILAWHSFFHLDRDSQRAMFEVFAAHLKSGGVLAFTSGDEEGEVWSDNGGEMLYHASLSASEYERLLAAKSFDVLIHAVRDPECGEATVWVVRKK